MQVDLPKALPANFRFYVGQNVQLRCKNGRTHPGADPGEVRDGRERRPDICQGHRRSPSGLPTLSKRLFGGRGFLRGERVKHLPGLHEMNINGDWAYHKFNPFLRDQGRTLNFESIACSPRTIPISGAVRQGQPLTT